MAYAVGIIHEENGTFGISFPDFPGAISSGRSMEEAVAKGAEMLAFHVDGLAEDKALPEQVRTLDLLRKQEPDWFTDGVAVLVPVEIPGNVVRVNISVDERDLERIDRAAKGAGMTRSGFMVKASVDRLRGAEHLVEVSAAAFRGGHIETRADRSVVRDAKTGRLVENESTSRKRRPQKAG